MTPPTTELRWTSQIWTGLRTISTILLMSLSGNKTLCSVTWKEIVILMICKSIRWRHKSSENANALRTSSMRRRVKRMKPVCRAPPITTAWVQETASKTTEVLAAISAKRKLFDDAKKETQLFWIPRKDSTQDSSQNMEAHQYQGVQR